MRLLLLTLAVLATLALGSQPSFCQGHCHPAPCVSSSDCGYGCVCMKSGISPTGGCVRFD